MQRTSLFILALSIVVLSSSAEARSPGGTRSISERGHVNSPVSLVHVDPRYRPHPETPTAKIGRVIKEYGVTREYWHPPRHRSDWMVRTVAKHHQIRLRHL